MDCDWRYPARHDEEDSRACRLAAWGDWSHIADMNPPHCPIDFLYETWAEVMPERFANSDTAWSPYSFTHDEYWADMYLPALRQGVGQAEYPGVLLNLYGRDYGARGLEIETGPFKWEWAPSQIGWARTSPSRAKLLGITMQHASDDIPGEIARVNQWLNSNVYHLTVHRDHPSDDHDMFDEIFPHPGDTTPTHELLDDHLTQWSFLTEEEEKALPETSWA